MPVLCFVLHVGHSIDVVMPLVSPSTVSLSICNQSLAVPVEGGNFSEKSGEVVRILGIAKNSGWISESGGCGSEQAEAESYS